MSSVKLFLKRHKSAILLAVIIVLAVRVFIPQVDTLIESLQTLRDAKLSWVLLAIVLFYTGVPVIATQLTALSLKKLSYKMTLRVQAAALFVNKILPQGVGTISINIYYFIKKGHTPNQAGTALTVNAITSLVAYIILIAAALVASDIKPRNVLGTADFQANISILGMALIVGAIITAANMTGVRGKVSSSWQTFKANIMSYRNRPSSIVVNIVLNGVGTSLNVLTLVCCAQALGMDVSFANALLAYTFGNVASTLVPTPGGLGSAEIGISSGLIAVGLEPAAAISVTLLYRLVSYWLAILPGLYFFNGLKKTVFSDYSTKSAA